MQREVIDDVIRLEPPIRGVRRAANQNVPMVSYLENYRRDAAVSGCKTQTF